MAYSPRTPLVIDLDLFKLHLNIHGIRQLSLHFDTPSRRFYLSLIALVVEQMRQSGRTGSVPLEEHAEVLALLNETVGGSAGSSRMEKLLPRIYRKWKDALPDLENAPLFKVMGAKKGYDEVLGKIYQFDPNTEDAWANLFEYTGSREKVRLRFSVEKLGIKPEDVAIVFENQSDTPEERAWDRFVERLTETFEATRADRGQNVSSPEFPKGREASGRPQTELRVQDPTGNKPAPKRWKRFGFTLISSLFLLTAAVALWFHAHPTFQQGTTNSEVPVSTETSDEASIAVLPFANIKGDPKEDYLSDGITDEIITALSKTPKMFVIARNSVFTYKGKPVMVQQVSEELGVRYVLEGSVQRSGDRLRIAAQLVDGQTGKHVWSERYDRELKDLFAIQDEITMKIIEGLRVHLTEGDQGRVYSRGTDNLKAYLKALEGGDLAMALRSKDDNALARHMIEQAIALDPEYVNAYVLLAWTHLHDWTYGWTNSLNKSLERGLDIAQKAVAMDDSNPSAHSVVEAAYRRLGMLKKALAAGKRAVALAPNGAEINALHSATLLRVGMNEEAIARINKAIRLNPICPMWYFTLQGDAYRNTGRYEEAVKAYKKAILLKPTYVTAICGLGEVCRMTGQNEEAIRTFKKALRLNPNFHRAHVQLVVSYSLTGQKEEAHAEAKEVLRTYPDFSVDRFSKAYLGGHRKAQRDIITNALHDAGLE
jgi:adenylate cyclase